MLAVIILGITEPVKQRVLIATLRIARTLFLILGIHNTRLIVLAVTRVISGIMVITIVAEWLTTELAATLADAIELAPAVFKFRSISQLN